MLPTDRRGTNALNFLASDLALRVGGRLQGEDLPVTGLATLESAGAGDLSFLANPRYRKYLQTTSAGVVLVRAELLSLVPHSAILVDNPYLAFARLSQLFDWRVPLSSGIHETAVVEVGVSIDETAQICAGAVIEAGAQIGPECFIGANTVVGRGSVIGAHSRIEANVSIYPDVVIGERCLIHSGAVLGADGFGFAPSQSGWQKIAQLGGVRIGNDVEIGAGTTIDRGALDSTLIADGVKLDNQIQIAHNVQIGERSAIAGCTAVAGSTKIGKDCTIGGLSGIAGHLEIADGTHITAMTLVSRSIREAGAYSSGTGLEAHSQWKKNVVRFRQLDSIAKRVRDLEMKLEQLSAKG